MFKRKSTDPNDYLTGQGKPNYPRAVSAKCCDCMNGLHMDCQIPDCSLYAWQPYAKMTPDYTWIVSGQYAWNKTRGGCTPDDSPEDNNVHSVG
jgi:hypothetical protein